MGVILGSYGGGNVLHFFGICLWTPPPLIFHNFGAQKNVLQSFGSGRDPPPPFGKFPEKNRFFLWIASLSLVSTCLTLAQAYPLRPVQDSSEDEVFVGTPKSKEKKGNKRSR